MCRKNQQGVNALLAVGLHIIKESSTSQQRSEFMETMKNVCSKFDKSS